MTNSPAAAPRRSFRAESGHPRGARRRRAAGALAAVLSATLSCGMLAPAYADSGQHQTPTVISSQAQSDLAGQYQTLSGALINLYARNSGMTLQQYLASQQVLLSAPALPDPLAPGESAPLPSDPAAPSALPTDAATPTTPPTGESTPGATTPAGTTKVPTSLALGTADVLGDAASSAKPVSAATLGDLNKQLAGAGLTISTKGYSNLDALARSIVAKSHTADGAVALAGAKWMSGLSKLRTPGLKTPSVSSPTMPGLPKNSLVFGLFADKSLTNVINTSPNLFAQAGKSGVGSKALQQAFSSSMLKVYNSSKADWSSMLPDPCTGGMLAVMASGKASSAKKVSGSGCSSSCVSGGLYLNSQTSNLFSPGSNTALGNPYSSVWSSSTLTNLQRWQQKQLLSQNPKLTQQMLSDTQPAASASCSASSKATKNALGATLPGIFGQLRTK